MQSHDFTWHTCSLSTTILPVHYSMSLALLITSFVIGTTGTMNEHGEMHHQKWVTGKVPKIIVDLQQSLTQLAHSTFRRDKGTPCFNYIAM